MVKRITRIAAISLLLWTGISAQTAAPAPTPASQSAVYSDDINKITAGATNADRGKAIQDALKASGIDFKTEDFNATNRAGEEVKGTNILVTMAAAKPTRTIMIGAHLDKVKVGAGAIDNASGSAAVLALLRALKANPMKNVTVMAGFWDKEEIGLVGSREFVKSREKTGLPAVYINFDVYGSGDTIWLQADDANSAFAKSFADTAKAAKFGHLVSKEYPPSDHLSFKVTGVESFSFSLGPASEAATIIKVLKREKVEPADFPKVLQVIHTANDTTDKVDSSAVAKSLAVIEAAIRTLDK